MFGVGGLNGTVRPKPPSPRFEWVLPHRGVGVFSRRYASRSTVDGDGTVGDPNVDVPDAELLFNV
jgi:hypothetical protein